MKIKVHQIPEDGLSLEGDEPASILDIPGTLFRFERPVHYQVEALWVGRRSLLVRGRLSTVVKARCVRTLEWFDLPVHVEDFQCHRPTVHGDEVDLTEEIREDILLVLPSNPVSPQARPVSPHPGDRPKSSGDVWKKLDQLKLFDH